MKAYKGFEKQADGSLKCRDFTYEEGKTYELSEKEIELCEKGFHACKELHQCWPYYPHKSEHIVYHKVECEGKIIESDDGDGKVCCSKITIGKAVDVCGIPMFDMCGLFFEGYGTVKKGEKYTHIDSNGEYLIKDESERWFDWIGYFHNGYARVWKGEKYTYIDTNGEYLIKDEGERWFDWCGDFQNGYAMVEKGGKWTFIDTEGKLIGDGKQWFDDCCDFQNGYAVVAKGEKWTFIDANGEYLFKDEGEQWFDDCGDFKNGYARVREGGKWTYINTEGEYLVKDKSKRWFDVCWDFENGIADVLLDSGEWKKIDANGEYVE